MKNLVSLEAKAGKTQSTIIAFIHNQFDLTVVLIFTLHNRNLCNQSSNLLQILNKYTELMWAVLELCNCIN